MNAHTLRAGIALSGVALLALTACAPRDGGQGGGTPIVESALVDSLPAATKTVDSVTWAVVEGEPQTLDPKGSANVITPNLCESLLRLQPDFSVTAGVASKADWVNPVTFVIELRDGVTFWDGSPVTPADVMYSLKRNMDPSSQWYAAFVLVSGMEQTGEREVTVHFTMPDTTFRDALTGGGGAVMSAAFGEKAGPALGTPGGGLLCTGPFVLGNWTPGTDIETTANEHYWGGAPLVHTLKYAFVTDGATLTTALTAGSIDGAYNVPPGARSALEGEGAGRLVLGHSTASYSFGPTTNQGAAANPKIRRALSMAIDRSQYIDTVLHGLGDTQKTFVPPFVWNNMEAKDIYQAGYDALPDAVYDIEAARKLVADSGEDTSKPLVVAVPAGAPEFTQTAAIMQSAAQQIGLTITINEMQPADFGALFYVPEARQGIDFVATTGFLDTPGVLGYPQLFLMPAEFGGVFNWSGYNDALVIADIKAARTATDPESAAKSFVHAQEIFAPDQLQVTLAGAYQLTYLSKHLTGAVTSVALYSSPWALMLGAA